MLVPSGSVSAARKPDPGELLHLEVKKLGRIVQVGHRMTGNRRDTVNGAGWDYLHIAIDDASRVPYAQILPEENADCTVAFLRAAAAYYAGLGVRIKGVCTDNALAYRGRDFTTACAALGLSHH